MRNLSSFISGATRVEACIIDLRKQKRDRRITHQRDRKQIDNRGWRFIISSREGESRYYKRSPHSGFRERWCPSHQGLDHFVGEIRDSQSRSRTRAPQGVPRLRRTISTFSVLIWQGCEPECYSHLTPRLNCSSQAPGFATNCLPFAIRAVAYG